MSTVTVSVSDIEKPRFTYDPSAQGWRRSEPDTGPFIDADTDTPLLVSTLIVQQVVITASDKVVDVNGQTGVDHEVTGSGKAQVFTAGRGFDTTWTQGSSGLPSFGSGGQAPPIAPGLVWICFVASGNAAS